jgi:hypothetical protein
MNAAELGQYAGECRPVRTGCIFYADDSLMMATLKRPISKAAPSPTLFAVGILLSMIGRPLGDESASNRLRRSRPLRQRPR